MSLDSITIISCIVIVCVLLGLIYKAWCIKSKATHLIKQATESEDSLSRLRDTKLAGIEKAYAGSIKIKVEGKLKTNIPASEFFSEFTVCKAIGINTKMIDAGSGTLVGLGLLGTFLGLTLGIWNFDSSSSDHIQASIQALLNGMGTAFITSLVGMGGSLCYTYIEKKWRNSLSNALFDFCDKLDDNNYIDDIELSTYNQKIFIENATNTLTTQFASVADTLYGRLVPFLQFQDGHGNRVALSNAVREILINNQEQTQALKSFSTDLALQLNDIFDETLSRQMQQRLIPLMESVDATTKAVVEHIDQMVMQFSHPATIMIEEAVKELKATLLESMEAFKSTLSNKATTELENLALSLGSATRVIEVFPQNMSNISSTLQGTISEVKDSIKEITQASASANTTAMQQMQEQIVSATSSMSASITEVKEIMSHVTQMSEQSSKDVIENMTKSSKEMAALLQLTVSEVKDSISDISTSTASANSTAMQQMQEQIVFATTSISDAVADIKGVMTSLTQSSAQSSQEMIKQVSTSYSEMSGTLNGTMNEISTTLQKTVQTLSSELVSKQADLLALQEITTKEIGNMVTEMSKSWTMSSEAMLQRNQALLGKFDDSMEHLNQIHDAMSNTMKTFQQAQGYITGTTSNLQSITEEMRGATDNFRKSQSEYATSLEQIQTGTSQKLNEILTLLETAGSTTDEYAQKFEIIRSGLGQIFSQIQAGLNEYSNSVRSSLQRYLEAYSTNLTNTTDALASTIQQQNEMVEMLVETVNQKRK